MKVLIYNSQDHKIKNIFQAQVNFPGSYQVKYIKDYEEFSKQTQLCLAGESIIIFFAKNSEEMDYLQTKMKYISDVKLIIGLVNDDGDLFSRALTLYPNYTDHSYKNIISVLNKIIQNENEIVNKKNR